MRKSILSFFVITSLYYYAYAQKDAYNYSEESQLFQQVAAVSITAADGKQNLSNIYNGSPLIIAFVYTRCSGICSPFLSNVSENITAMNPSENFKILAVSFDPADKLEDMQNLARSYGLDKDKRWIFATTNQINELIASVGFHPIWDSVKMQFDHEALIVGINQDGYIAKKLTGIRSTNDMSLMIKDLSGDFTVSFPLPGNTSIFSCFNYNPSTGEKEPAIGLLFLAAPFIISLAIVIIISIAAKRYNKSTTYKL